MKYSELKRFLKKNGCRFDHDGGGHEIWYSSKTGLYFSVGRHDKADCKKGTLNSILKDAGLK